jgi:hypothetical protein
MGVGTPAVPVAVFLVVTITDSIRTVSALAESAVVTDVLRVQRLSKLLLTVGARVLEAPTQVETMKKELEVLEVLRARAPSSGSRTHGAIHSGVSRSKISSPRIRSWPSRTRSVR